MQPWMVVMDTHRFDGSGELSPASLTLPSPD
jgi:hypothetical protein